MSTTEWKQANIKKPITYRAAFVLAPDLSDGLAAARVAWSFFSTEILNHYSKMPWEYVRCDFRLDTGRIAFFPAIDPFHQSQVLATCEMVSRELLDVWSGCAERNKLNDELFLSDIYSQENALSAVITKAANLEIFNNGSHPLAGRRVEYWHFGSKLIAREKFSA